MQKTKITPTMDGDYELLVEHSFSNQICNTSDQINNQSPNVIYTSNVCNNLTSTPISVAAHIGKEELNNTDQLTPRSGSISETSTSPEKGSDTSSGVHSNSSNGANCTPPPSALADKRSSSMESLMQQIQAAAAAKPCFRSLSLQRYMSSLPTEQNHRFIYNQQQRMPSNGAMSFETSDNTMVIRRTKRPQRTSDIFNTNSMCNAKNEPYFGRETNLRMTSFTENPEYMKFHSMPTQPKMVAIPSIPQSSLINHEISRKTINDFKLYSQNQNLYSHMNAVHKPIVSIAPQVMAINGSPNFLDQSSQRESVNYSFISSGCDPQVSEVQTT
jgi:hypothetical protein